MNKAASQMPGARPGVEIPATAGEHEHPALAPGVRLHGQMPGVGFTTPQWLIERNQQFLQVSELLYRVAALADGTRRVDEIADAVTEASDWSLEPAHVQHLIDKKLRPLGVIAGVDGQGSAPAPVSGGASPLRLNMRMRMIPPRIVERFTAVLQYAYAPAVFLPVAALIALAHWWLYAVRGVERGIENAFFQPGALGAVLALAVVAGLFHELGHSAALKYGGGRPRGIGFGLYMVFPAFYSDVTDSYRLGRWGRIRTDLGGIYFHLIFAAVLIGLSAWTGNEFVIAAAILFNVEAIRQFIPFIRLDGYWLLADLTGVPDFFSQIGSFIRGLRPQRRYAVALPTFKPWVTAVFGLYLLFSIPAIVYVTGLIVVHLPDLAALTERALLVQSRLWTAAEEPLTRALIATQVVLAPVPLAASVYFLYLMVSAVVSYVAARTGWNAPALPVRRLAGATALAGLGAFVVMAWAPATPDAVGAQSAVAEPAVAEPDESNPAFLLDRARRATERLESLQADLTGALGDERISGRMLLGRPNRALIEIRGAQDSLGTYRVISNGSKLFVFFPESLQFTALEPAADGGNINAFVIDHVRTFFKPERLAPGKGQPLKYAGREVLDGAEYDVVELPSPDHAPSWRYYISTADHLVHRIVAETSRDGRTSSRVVHLENIRVNAPIDERQLQWTPPEGATPLGIETLGKALTIKRPQH